MGALPSMQTAPSPWNFFDAIFCITLISRPDRTAEAKRQFAQVGLDGQVEFFITHKHATDEAEGIYHSHQECLKQGLSRGAQRILIFEDDILFQHFFPERLHAACLALEHDPVWNAFFLGCLTSGRSTTGCRHLRRIRYRCLTHAYALNRPYAEQIVNRSWDQIPIDGVFRRDGSHFYALAPMCAFQGDQISDNRTVTLDRFRTLCGGLAFIQRCNEFFYNYKLLIILLHIVVGSGILAFFLLTP